MTSMTSEEVQKLLASPLGSILSDNLPPGRINEEFCEFLNGFDLLGFLYVPDDLLRNRVRDYTEWCQSRVGEDPGHLMEELALLAFKCLKGWDSLKSFQSYAPQHDLVVSGSQPLWALLMEHLHLSQQGRSIVIEAKNEESAVSDSQLSRLASIMQNKFEKLCELGVFFTRKGAAGFPERSEELEVGQKRTRQRSLQNARATQILFHAKTGKYIVVLDDSDVRMLVEKGSLPRILEAKIKDVEEATGLPITFDENWLEIDLPSHLRQYISSSDLVN